MRLHKKYIRKFQTLGTDGVIVTKQSPNLNLLQFSSLSHASKTLKFSTGRLNGEQLDVGFAMSWSKIVILPLLLYNFCSKHVIFKCLLFLMYNMLFESLRLSDFSLRARKVTFAKTFLCC